MTTARISAWARAPWPRRGRGASGAICRRRGWSPRRCAATRPASAPTALWSPRRAGSPAARPRTSTSSPTPSCRDEIDWGTTNQPLEPRRFAGLLRRAVDHVAGRELFVQDLYAGADPAHRLKVRVVTEQAWHNLFARNMFIRPSAAELHGFEPDWVVLQLPSLEADPAIDGTNSSTVIAVDFRQRLVLIVGTAYAGEIKKSIFTVLNYLLPAAGVMPMHCSANVGADGRRRRVLRPVRHRQDHALGRSQPHADRRRRAWLGPGRRVQLRGRLLRQGDPARRRGRARDLRRLDPLRHRAGERRPRPRDRGTAVRRRQPDREHAQLLPARVHPQRQPRPAGPATRPTSSC